MFSVFVNQLDCSCESLQLLARRRYYEMQNIDKVINALGSLSGMEQVIMRLKSKKEELEEQQQKLLDMVQGLMKISRLYRTAENRICEYGEACSVRYKYSYQLEKYFWYTWDGIERTPIRII